ncbi:ABC transporter ATP-binding protein [Arthrobacter sp. AK01]|uniref:ABC transporter ATP-binding protein n=1 Tax=Micrococcaceae TaxID=1268 RepID=UPI001E62D440|nr:MULTISPECIES: ABC transporter ATP-binding protein [Micrococcaceae]MCD4852027.1 ABC transporter ATP-binding protein [Arthrobacter sp. AK01]MCP1413754.1 NitT/TauT family transport system ATP-binding protein [Paenarthrobacter sp. A20]
MMTHDPHIDVAGASKTYPNGTIALQPVELQVAKGEFVSLLGPSGCGKSTLLRIIAGLSAPSSGEVAIPKDDRRAFVFQDATLLPWRTVEGNASLICELESIDKTERRKRVAAALKMVGLEGFERSYPRNLSGGMKMRLSLARALALQPELFLMDEPFSALDELTREILQDELLRIWLSKGFTSVFVTHNLYEAIYLSNRVVVMSARPGRVERIFDVPFAYPRTPELRRTHEFTALSVEISECLRERANA